MSDKIYTEIELTVSVATTLVGAAVSASIEADDKGYHYTAMRTIQDARKLLPALGECEVYPKLLNTLYDIYSQNADAKKTHAA